MSDVQCGVELDTAQQQCCSVPSETQHGAESDGSPKQCAVLMSDVQCSVELDTAQLFLIICNYFNNRNRVKKSHVFNY